MFIVVDGLEAYYFQWTGYSGVNIFTTEVWIYLSSYIKIKETSYNIRRLVCGAQYHEIG
jgi:hypothetical protein